MTGTTVATPRVRCARVRTLRRDLRSCMIDGLFYAIMVGLAEVYVAAFVLRLGLGPIAAGLITTIPVLVGAGLQLLAPRIIRRVGSYPRFMLYCAGLQGLMYLPLAAIALAGPWLTPWLREMGSIHALSAIIFLVWIAYWTFSAATGPAWQNTAGAIIPARVRAGYFARRSRILHVATLFSILFQGVVMTALTSAGSTSTGGADAATAPVAHNAESSSAALATATTHAETTTAAITTAATTTAATTTATWDPVLLVFAGLFTLACVCRLVSAWYLGQYSEPRVSPKHERRVRPTDAAWRAIHAPDGRYLLYTLAVLGTAQVAGPYFNPYMIEILKSDQTPMFESAPFLGPALSWLLAGAILGRILALPTVGLLSRRYGARRILAISGWLLVPGPLFWLATDEPILLFIGQIVFGVVWAGFELSTFLLNYVMLKPEERTSMLTLFAAANELGKSAGSLAGAGLLIASGEGRFAYTLVFWASALARLATIPLLARVREPAPHGLATTQVIDPGPPAGHTGEGSMHEPLLADAPSSHDVATDKAGPGPRS
jgi:hypothetical protein